jgi:hypothetical protein
MKVFFLYILSLSLVMFSCRESTVQSNAIDNSPEPKQFVKIITVRDVSNEVICKNQQVSIDSVLNESWKGKDSLELSFDEFVAIEDHIIRNDMMTLEICSGILERGQFAITMAEYKKKGRLRIKKDFVSDLDWLKVNANDISCRPVLWGAVYGEEFFNAYHSAVKSNLSWAEFYLDWDKFHDGVKVSNDYLKQAEDSLFKKGAGAYKYYLPWRESPEYAFHVWDIHTIMDWDGDGYADRIIRWVGSHGAGVGRVTRKGTDERLEFYEIATY